MTPIVIAEIQVSGGRSIKHFLGVGRHSLIECSRKLVMALARIVSARDPVIVGSDIGQDLWDAVTFLTAVRSPSDIRVAPCCIPRQSARRFRKSLRRAALLARRRRSPTRRGRQEKAGTRHGPGARA